MLATAFVGSSITQVAGAIFGENRAGSARLGAPCRAALGEHAAAVDAARLSAGDAEDGDDAQRRFADAMRLHGRRANPAAAACAADPDAPAALAVLSRYERASESAAVRRSAELGPMRRQVDSFIR